MVLKQDSNNVRTNHYHCKQLGDKPSKITKNSNHLQKNSLDIKTSQASAKHSENHSIPKWGVHNSILKSFQSQNISMEKGSNQKQLENCICSKPNSLPPFSSNHSEINHVPVKVDIETIPRTPYEENSERPKSIYSNKSAFNNICGTPRTKTASSKALMQQEVQLVKETTFPAQPLGRCKSSTFLRGRSFSNMNISQLNGTVNVDSTNKEAPLDRSIFYDPIHCEKMYSRSIPECQRRILRMDNCDSTSQNFLRREATLSDSTPNVIEMNSFSEDPYYLSPNSTYLNIENESHHFDSSNKANFQRTYPKTKFKRNSRTRRAQRRKRTNRVIHSKARRNSAILAKNLPYKPKATRFNEDIPDNFYSALLTMLFCCLPLGIASMVYTYKVHAYLAIPDREKAQQSSLLGRKLANTGVMLGVTTIAYVVVFFVVKSNIPFASVEYDYYLPDAS